MTDAPALERRLKVSGALLGLFAALLYAAQFAVIIFFTVDAPFWDEWQFFAPDALPAGFSLRYIFAPHNEHRIFGTKLLYWALYKLGGLDFTLVVQVSYALYGLTIVALIRVLQRSTPRQTFPLVLWFTPFLSSPLNYENLVWGLQSCFHLFALFFVVAVGLLFEERQRWGACALGAAAAACATYSFASGVVCTLVLGAMYAGFKLLRVRSAPDRARELAQGGLVLGVIAAADGLWLATFEAAGHHGAMSVPTSSAFWLHYANVVGLGFGIRTHAPGLGLLVLGTVIVLLVVFARGVKRRAVPQNHAFVLLTLALAMLGAQASISLGRGSFGAEQGKSLRYAEYGLLMLPVLGAMLAWLSEQSRRLLVVAAVAWVVCFASFFDEWTFGPYEGHSERLQAGLSCALAQHPPGPVICPDVYSEDLSSRIAEARKLGVSFTRQVVE